MVRAMDSWSKKSFTNVLVSEKKLYLNSSLDCKSLNGKTTILENGHWRVDRVMTKLKCYTFGLQVMRSNMNIVDLFSSGNLFFGGEWRNQSSF